jgi:hypothetical protein
MKSDSDSIENDRIYWSDWISWVITHDKIIRILIEHVNNQQCSVQLSSQTTDNSTLPIDDVRNVSQITDNSTLPIDNVPDVSQIQSLSTPNPNSSEFVHPSTSILHYLKTVPQPALVYQTFVNNQPVW